MRKEKIEELEQYKEELRILSKEYIKEPNYKFITTETYLFKLNNKRTITRERIIKNNKDGSAVIIVPILEKQEILTVIEPRVFTKTGLGVGFPAGYIENKEEPIESAKRELLEETGYKPQNLILLDSFYQDEGCSSAYNHIFVALNSKKVANQKLDKDEIIKYMTFTYKELIELEELGYINGANSKIALTKTKKYIKEK